MDYYKKYIKYKTKYIQLKNQIQGGEKKKCGKQDYDTTTHFCSR